MNASVQSNLGAAELAVLLALVRGGNLAGAGQLAGVDGSTVFRTVQRAEKALGQRLFERSRSGYRPTELGQRLAQHAERIEAELEAARAEARLEAGAVRGVVRIATTDTMLKGLLLPVLTPLHAAHPGLRLEITARNEPANLTQREADIALRATAKPPPHVVGRQLGVVRNAVFAPKPTGRRAKAIDLAGMPWVGVDDAMPEHPSVRWRKKQWPRVEPVLCVNSVQAVFDAVAAGVGLGLVPVFMARGRRDVVQVGEVVAESDVQLWLLTHPESRHLRRIAVVAAYLAQHITL
ncbi:MAG: LysR family transcriptional regulator [Rhizobacter sp.]|nr:LysR family transcriptional regulator [Rhizobacter sp.]